MRNRLLTVYSKFCIDCVWPEKWVKVQKFAAKNGFKLNVERTTYHPRRHEKAANIWGSDSYTAFLVTPKGHPIALVALAGYLTKEGEWRNDVSGLRRTKNYFREDKPMVAGPKNKPKNSCRRKGDAGEVDGRD